MAKRLVVVTLIIVAGACFFSFGGENASSKYAFQAPIMLKAGDQAIRVESPGWACPSWADVDGDGKKDLVVGQFNGGKMHVYKHLGERQFAERAWLQADGKDAIVPGVW